MPATSRPDVSLSSRCTGAGAFSGKARGDAVAVPGAALNGKPRWLGDDDHVFVFEHDVESPTPGRFRSVGPVRFRASSGKRLRKGRHAHGIAFVQAVEGLGPASVDAHLTGAYPAVKVA